MNSKSLAQYQAYSISVFIGMRPGVKKGSSALGWSSKFPPTCNYVWVDSIHSLFPMVTALLHLMSHFFLFLIPESQVPSQPRLRTMLSSKAPVQVFLALPLPDPPRLFSHFHATLLYYADLDVNDKFFKK